MKLSKKLNSLKNLRPRRKLPNKSDVLYVEVIDIPVFSFLCTIIPHVSVHC